MQELIVIALVALFVLGPERLPVVMRAGGRLLTRVRNYGVTASKELRGVADLGGLSGIEQEVTALRRELDRTRADLRRAMRETVSASDPKPVRSTGPASSRDPSVEPVTDGPTERPELPDGARDDVRDDARDTQG
jgi:Sec-independent protein translocase protein TatA